MTGMPGPSERSSAAGVCGGMPRTPGMLGTRARHASILSDPM